MKEREKPYEGKNLLNLAEGLRKSDVVVKIVDRLTEGFGESIELIMNLVCLPVELLDELQKCFEDKDLVRFIIKNVIDAERFFENKDYREKVLTDFYMLKYPYLLGFKFEGCELVRAWLEWYNATELPDLPISLQSLEVQYCDKLTSLSGIEKLKSLQRLYFQYCDKLTSLSGIEKLKNLQSLSVLFCKDLTSLSGIEKLKSLQSLEVQYCDKLTSLSGLEACVNLRMLEIDSHSQKNLDSKSKKILKGLEENPDVEVVYT